MKYCNHRHGSFNETHTHAHTRTHKHIQLEGMIGYNRDRKETYLIFYHQITGPRLHAASLSHLVKADDLSHC